MTEATYTKDAQELRIAKILGSEDIDVCDEATETYLKYLKNTLDLPCKVTGVEDFRWEEFYIIGLGDQGEHNELRKTQPSCMDTYMLIDIEKDIFSEWMMFSDEDLAAKVKRISDKKEFWLGLSEIEATDNKSKNYQLLHDYSVWLINFR